MFLVCSILHLEVDHQQALTMVWLLDHRQKSSNNISNEDGHNPDNPDQLQTGTSSSVSMMMSKKYQTFIRCSVKLLISSGNKHKNFLDANSGLLQDILVQLISNIEEELAFYEGNLFCNKQMQDQLLNISW